MAISAGDAVWTIDGDLNPLSQKLGQATAEVESATNGIVDTLAGIGKGMTIAGGAITGAIGGVAYLFGSVGDEIQKMSLRTGVSTEALSELKFILEQNGSSLGAFDMAQRNLTRSIDQASEGTGVQAEAIQRLGLDYDTLRAMSPEEQFKAVAFAIGAAGDHTTQAALAMELFGSRVGTQLLPMIKGGEEGFNKLAQEARDLGIVMDQETADSAAAFTDAMNTLKHSFEGVVIAIGPAIAQIAEELVPKIVEVVGQVREWVAANPGLVETLVKVGLAVGGIMTVLGPLFIMLPGIVTAFGLIASVLSGPVIIAIAAAAAAGLLLYESWDYLKAGAEVLWDGIVAAWKVGVEAVKIVLSLLAATFTSQWEVISTVASAGAEAVSAVWGWLSETASAVFGGLVDFFTGIWDTITGIFTSAWEYISGIVTGIIDAISQAIGAIGTFLGLTGGGGGPGVAIPARAGGGPVEAGRGYLVGEEGPEWFEPSTSGNIMSAPQTAAMGGLGGGITINISGVSMNSNSDVDALAQRLGEKLRQRLTGIGYTQDWRPA